MNPMKGFTLIEILVALVILAIVGALMVTGLQSATRSQKIINQKENRLTEVQTAIIMLERDIAQTINRPILNNDGTKLAAISVSYPGGKLHLEFTHAGLINPLGFHNRSTLERVDYFWDGENLMRTAWQALDRMPNSLFDTEIILTGVKAYSVRFLDPTSHEFTTPGETPSLSSTPQALTPPLPLAIEINLEVNGMGTISRIIALPG